MSIHASHWIGVAISLLVGAAGPLACGGTRQAPKSPAARAAVGPPPAAAAPSPTASTPGGGETPGAAPKAREPSEESADEDAELVVSRDVVAACPTLRLVRIHMDELDQDMVWLAVLEAIGDCMGEGGAMAEQSIGVSGDEEHRHIVREVLGTQGVAPTRVVAKPQSVQGAAECQGGSLCGKRVEITIVAP